jgi:hypothetical protein
MNTSAVWLGVLATLMLAGNATAQVEGSEPSAIVEMGGAGIDS